ncbi:hypothetical protein [Roseibium sp. TrichSKD4]|nr:hypothetical protein [Roseibium sp. TrichSKD4]
MVPWMGYLVSLGQKQNITGNVFMEPMRDATHTGPYHLDLNETEGSESHE